MNQIGTLSEKSIHSLVKDYIEPNKEYQEVKVGNYIADIKKDNLIYEIQTQQFKNLLGKINYYTSCKYRTIIVHPIAKNKYINWVEPSSMEIVERRKTPHKGVIQDIFKELYWIVDYLDNPLVELNIILLDVEEYKYLDGYGQNSKKRATKIDKVPTKVNEIVQIKSISDLIKFLPDTLPEKFTSKDFIKHSKCNKRWAGSGLKMLRDRGIINIVEKSGNSFIYTRSI
jgi:hypothetical protein